VTLFSFLIRKLALQTLWELKISLLRQQATIIVMTIINYFMDHFKRWICLNFIITILELVLDFIYFHFIAVFILLQHCFPFIYFNPKNENHHLSLYFHEHRKITFLCSLLSNFNYFHHYQNFPLKVFSYLNSNNFLLFPSYYLYSVSREANYSL
jgi:hypothetical protein